jgi:cell division protease FtsH
MVMRLPERDQISLSRAQMKANLVVGLGGRIAEELIFGHEEVTAGASGDITMITNLAKRMVMEWGMSDKLGPLRYNENQEEVFLGHSVARQQHMSEATAQMVDAEVRRIIDDAYEVCRTILNYNIDQLHAVAQALLEYETLSGDEIKAIIRGEAIRVGGGDDDEKPRSGARASVPTSARKPKGSPGGLGPDPSPGPA